MGLVQAFKMNLFLVIFLSSHIQVFGYRSEVGEELDSIRIRFCHIGKMTLRGKPKGVIY